MPQQTMSILDAIKTVSTEVKFYISHWDATVDAALTATADAILSEQVVLPFARNDLPALRVAVNCWTLVAKIDGKYPSHEGARQLVDALENAALDIGCSGALDLTADGPEGKVLYSLSASGRRQRCLDLAIEAEEKGLKWNNEYQCYECGTVWNDHYDCQCDDECPTCGKSNSPEKSSPSYG